MVQIITVNDKEVRELFKNIQKLPADLQNVSRILTDRMAMAVTSKAASVGFSIKANSYKEGSSSFTVSVPRHGLALDGDVAPFRDASKKGGWFVPIRGPWTKKKAREWWIRHKGQKNMPSHFFLRTRPFIRAPINKEIARMDQELRRAVDRRVR